MAATDMTSDELRAHLYRSLQGKGVLDSLKSQLRNRLARELQNALEGRGESSPPAPPVRGQSSMTMQVANSMVAEYLQKVGFEFTLSIFLPEAGVNMGKLFTSEDLMRFMKIPPSCPLQSQNEQGFLVRLIEGLATQDVGQAPARTCVAVQTDHEGRDQRSTSATPSVAAKLQALDESYAHKAEEETRKSQQAVEERMAVFQRECERQHQRQLEAEMAHFRERELARMREEERERCEEEVGRVREELQGAHRQKLEAVRKMELEALQRLRRKEQELEAGVYTQRQALLEEMEVLKMREAELKRQAELNRQAASLEEERVRSLMEQLAGREKAMVEMKEQYEHMAEERIGRYKLECDAALQSKRSELARWETELRAGQQQVPHLQSESQRLGAELREEKGKTESLQGFLHEATTQQVALQHQKETLQQRVDQMGDYQHLKQRASELQRQLLAAERKFSEAKSDHRRRSSDLQQLVRQLQTRLAQPSHELCTLQSELEQMRKTHHKEMLATEYDNKQLRHQLAVQSESYLALQQQLDERTVQLRSMQREVEDLQSQLELLHATFVPAGRGRREVAGAKGAGAEGKSSLLRSKKTTAAGPKLTAGLRKPIPHPLPHKPSTPYSESLSALLGSHDVSFSDSSGQFLAETRASFARLEKEAAELDKSYREFQQRLAPGISSSILHEPIAHSPLLEDNVMFQSKELAGMATPLLSNGRVASGRGEVPIQTQMPQTMAALYASPSNWPVSDHHPNESVSREFEPASPSLIDAPSPVTTRSYETMYHRVPVPLPSPHSSPTLSGEFQLASTHALTESQLASIHIPAVQTYPAATTPAVQTYPAATTPAVQTYPAATTPAVQTYPAATTPAVQTYPAATTPAVQTYPAATTPAVQTYPAATTPAVQTYPAAAAQQTKVTCSSPSLPSTVPSTRLPHAPAYTQLTTATSTLVSTREVSSAAPQLLLPPARFSSTVAKINPPEVATSAATTSVSAFPSATSKPPMAAAFSTVTVTSKPMPTAVFSTAAFPSGSITKKPPAATTATFYMTTSKPPIAASTVFAAESSLLSLQTIVHPTATSIAITETLTTSPVSTASIVLGSQQITEKLIQPTSLDTGQIVLGSQQITEKLIQPTSLDTGQIVLGSQQITEKLIQPTSLDTGQIVLGSQQITDKLIQPTSLDAGQIVQVSTDPEPQIAAAGPAVVPAKPVPRVSLDDLWKSSASPLQKSTAEEPGREPRTTTPGGSLEGSWETVRRQKEEEKERREREEDRVQRELELLQSEELKAQETHKPMSEGRGESITDTQRRPKSGIIKVEERRKEEREGEGKEEWEEEEGVDPVMLKYMELVRQRREQQDHSRGEEHKPSSGLEHDEQELLSAHSNGQDYGLPSLSQGSDRSFAYSDNNDDPFEDW